MEAIDYTKPKNRARGTIGQRKEFIICMKELVDVQCIFQIFLSLHRDYHWMMNVHSISS